MNKRNALTGIFGSLLLVFSLMSHAAEGEYYSDMKIVLTGNTVEGKISKHDMNYKMYFHPSGALIRIVDRGNAEKGKWRMNGETELCLKFATEECRTIEKRGEGRYDLYDKNGELGLTIVKVTIGNPEKMKH